MRVDALTARWIADRTDIETGEVKVHYTLLLDALNRISDLEDQLTKVLNAGPKD